MSVSSKLSISFVSKVITIILSFLTTIIISRFLGAEKYGMYKYLILIATTSYLLSNLGFYESVKQQTSARIIELNESFWGGLIFSITIFIGITIIFSILLLSGVKISLPINFIVILLIYFFFLVQDKFLFSLLIGVHKINAFNLLTLAKTFIILIVVVIALLLSELSIQLVLYAQIFVFIFGGIIIIFMLRPGKLIFRKFKDKNYVKQIFKRGLIIYVSNLSTFLNYRVDMFIIKLYHSFNFIGFYSIAVQIVEKFWIIPESIRTILFLEIVSERKKIDFVAQLTRIMISVMFLLSLITAVFSKPLILGLFGNEYHQSVTPLILLLPGIFVFSLSKLLSSYFFAIDQVIVNTKASIFSFILNIIINFALIPKYGIIGAAVATSFSYSLGAFIQLYIFIKITNLKLRDILLIKKNDFRFIYLKASTFLKRES